MDDCIFCQIIAGKLPAKIVFQSDNLIVFPDINPSADLHLLIVPKKHFEGIEKINQSHGPLLTEVYQLVEKLVEENNLKEDFYRVVVNGGKAQHIPHLHFHLLGGQWKRMV